MEIEGRQELEKVVRALDEALGKRPGRLHWGEETERLPVEDTTSWTSLSREMAKAMGASESTASFLTWFQKEHGQFQRGWGPWRHQLVTKEERALLQSAFLVGVNLCATLMGRLSIWMLRVSDKAMTQGDMSDLALILQGFDNTFVNLRMDLISVIHPERAPDRIALVQRKLWSHFNRALLGDGHGDRADFSGDVLRDEDFSRLRLIRTYYDGAELGLVLSEGANVLQRRYAIGLSGALFAGTDLEGSNFENTSLFSADLNNANLKNANLSGVNLTYAGLIGANLSGANLTDANLEGANLTNSVGLSREQLATASMDDLTNLPEYL